MGRASKYPAEVRERAVRLVFEQQQTHESQWAAICSVASKLGCTAETLRRWVRQMERDAGERPGLTTGERERLKELAASVAPAASVMSSTSAVRSVSVLQPRRR